MIAPMRTTVTLDPDVERLLKEAVHRSRSSFKAVLNNAVRRGLQPEAKAQPRKPFVVKARALGLRPGIDPARLAELADDLEIEEFVTKTRRAKKK